MSRIGKIEEDNKDRVSQSDRFIAKARELGLDEREEAFDAALTKVARHKSTETPIVRSGDHEDR